MRSFLRTGWLLLAICWMASAGGQTIKQSVLCASGDSDSLRNVQLRWTLGQCLGCGKLSNGSVIVVPGLPNGINSGTDQDCSFQNSFAYEFFSDTCGTYYGFEYTGSADIAQSSFFWDFGNDALPPTSSQINPQGIAYGSTGPKLVRLTVTQDSCTESVSTTFFVDQIGFSAALTYSDVACFNGSSGSIDLQPRGGTPPYTIEWEDGSTDFIRNSLSSGQYMLSLQDSEGCAFETVIELLQPDKAVSFTYSIDDETCTGRADGSIDISASGGTPPYFYTWSNGSTFDDLTNLSAGTYGLTLSDSNGCDTTGSFEVIDFCMAPDDFISTIITPNDDGMNDTWEIRGLYRFPEHEIIVYNRWGDVVWDTRNYQNDWRGTTNGGDRLPSAAYYYLIRLNDARNTTFQGAITIIR